MAVHDELSRLAAAAGPEVFARAEGFRAAFDDFVDEGSATPGELALLTDAIRTGALRRLLDQLDIGAEPAAALASQARALASDRGTVETEGAAWALAALAHAVGRLDAAEVDDHQRPPAPSAPPAPPTPSAPALPPPASSPPPPPAFPIVGPPRPAAPSRALQIAVAAAAVVLIVAGVVTVVLLTRGDDDKKRDDASDERTSSVSSRDATHQGPTDEVRATVQQFAEDAALEILEVDGSRYDAEVDEAAALMTDAFARSYRSTASSIRDEYVARGVKVTPEAVGNGLVGIDDDRATVLVFVDQTLRRQGEDPSVSPYRVVVALARSGGEDWLVDGMEVDQAPAKPTEPDADRRDALEAATATVAAFINIDHHDPQATVAAVLATATGTFAEQYEESAGDLVRLTRQNHTVMTGTVRAAGITSIGGDSARVVVATTGEVSNDATQGSPRDNTYRLRLDLVRADGRWLTSDVQFVS